MLGPMGLLVGPLGHIKQVTVALIYHPWSVGYYIHSDIHTKLRRGSSVAPNVACECQQGWLVLDHPGLRNRGGGWGGGGRDGSSILPPLWHMWNRLATIPNCK